jgi:hypothetical protein
MSKSYIEKSLYKALKEIGIPENNDDDQVHRKPSAVGEVIFDDLPLLAQLLETPHPEPYLKASSSTCCTRCE